MGFLDNMNKLMEIKQRMEDTKKRLETIEVTVENDYVKVIANGNRQIKNIVIMKTDDMLALQTKLQNAINEVLEKSDSLMQSEMLDVTKGMMPDA